MLRRNGRTQGHQFWDLGSTLKNDTKKLCDYTLHPVVIVAKGHREPRCGRLLVL
jgi:hypothetical protein